jgi:hypothetical protein
LAEYINASGLGGEIIGHTHPLSEVVGLVASIEHLRKEIENIRRACVIALLVMAFLAFVILMTVG